MGFLKSTKYFEKNNYKSFVLKVFVIISFVFCNMFLIGSISYADDIDLDVEEYVNSSDIQNINSVETSSDTNSVPTINSRSAIVIDRNSGSILYGKNEFNKVKMASTTKIMTATVIIENCALDEIVTVSKKAANTGGSRLGISTGDKISVNDLLYGLMLCSGNDAAVALAEHVGGSIGGFAVLMNQKAESLHLNNTCFESPHGLDSNNHYTTAYELATLSNYAMKNDTFSKIVNTKSTTISLNGNPKSISNTNELLGNLNGVYGIKTGFTNGANRCLVTACKRGDLDIICIVLGADTKKFRTSDSIKLLEYCFSNYTVTNIKDILNRNFVDWKSENLKDFNIEKSRKNSDLSLQMGVLKCDKIPIRNDLVNTLKTSINCEKNLEAPIFVNTVVGQISISTQDSVIVTTNIFIDKPIMKKDLFDYIEESLCLYKNCNLDKFWQY